MNSHHYKIKQLKSSVVVERPPFVRLVAQKNNLQLLHDDVVNAEAIPRELADALQEIFRSNCVQ